MKYLICQEWINTSKNHAGIKYLCEELERRYPSQYVSICIPDFFKNYSGAFILKKIVWYLSLIKYRKAIKKISKSLQHKLKEGDSVFLMEYMTKMYSQLPIAISLKKSVPKIPVYGMIHLVPGELEKFFPEPYFSKWKECIDKALTLGHSLSNYLVSKGYDKSNVKTLFHYVDIDYYRPRIDRLENRTLTVIAMGNQMRNVKLLRQIVEDNMNVNFIICQGVSNLSLYFEHCNNVQLVPFVPEDELKAYMDKADLSLNVMVDTVGSNVIVTSLAMGLAMVCSNVGSITDYCDESNSILCDNDVPKSFSIAIQKLNNNRELLKSMKQKSLEKSKELTINTFHEQIQLL